MWLSDSPYDRDGGRVPDARRIDFFRSELADLARAIKDGAKVRAFTLGARSITSSGTTAIRSGTASFTSTFAIRRGVKDSGLWYGQVAASNRLTI